MPIYEYRCRKCGRVCELLQKIGDPSPERCSICGGFLEKILSPPAIQFKGNGWYITDYARKESPPSDENKANGGKKEKPVPKKEKTSGESRTSSKTG